MRTSIRTVAVAATAVSLALLCTACSSDEAGDSGKGSAAPSASATSEAPAAKALSAAELEKLIVEQADLPGHQVQKAKASDVVKSETVVTDKASCKPLADALAFIATGDPAASVQRKAVEVPKKTGSPEDALGALSAPVTSVTLGSYDGQGAQEALASLKTAGTDCAGGFGVTSSGQKAKVTKVTPETVTAGDEALAWTVASDVDGEPFVTKLVVFRKGNTLASFSSFSLAGTVKELPKTIVEAQAKKLG